MIAQTVRTQQQTGNHQLHYEMAALFTSSSSTPHSSCSRAFLPAAGNIRSSKTVILGDQHQEIVCMITPACCRLGPLHGKAYLSFSNKVKQESQLENGHTRRSAEGLPTKAKGMTHGACSLSSPVEGLHQHLVQQVIGSTAERIGAALWKWHHQVLSTGLVLA